MSRALASAVLAVASAAVAVSGCGATVEPARLAAVQIASAEAPPHGCRELGPIEGKDSDRWVPGGPRYETAMLDLRRRAVRGGGNAVVLDSVEAPRDGDYMPTYVVRARLFVCGTGAPPEARAADAPGPALRPAAPLVCEPDCSPGYTCLRGACVSACNPVCPASERCGADRVCRPVAPLPPSAPVSG